MGLQDCQSECIDLFYAMGGSDLQKGLAAPFFSAPQEVDAPCGKHPILLVGKATDGDWKMECFTACARNKQIEERRRASQTFSLKCP